MSGIGSRHNDDDRDDDFEDDFDEVLVVREHLDAGLGGSEGARDAERVVGRAVVHHDDARILQEHIEYPSPKGYGTMRGYLARPSAAGRAPGVLVIHENRGLNPHIEDIARRLAVDGFVAFAPDALFPLGGYPGDEEKAREVFPKLDQTKTREDFVAAAGWLWWHGGVG